MNEQSIFISVLEREPADRLRFLDEACGDNPELRQRIEKLLASHEAALGFMEQPAGQLAPTSEPALMEKPGYRIGPYKLLQQIGEGGMGVVYMAEQQEPVRRKVALKIIKPGMDTRQVIARFEAERQALSLMDHPNIARVLDAGATDSGRPYFVMELVKGQPITQYCDEQHLTPRQRLELFLPVCQALQHAHQKGIIHRDVKPSNVLVAEFDGRPVAKVIDFGVAKATSHALTEKTMFTGFGQIVGTLEYMSPEQARVNQLDIDTRSDIYSLGVLLYELLTGNTPFDKQRLRSAAWEEMLRIIREEEPPKPSTRLADSKDSLASISAQRQTEPKQLTKLVRGELDWIVMKALEKERSRRYETATGLAKDIERYLANEPVEACPPSATYRLRKLARKHRTALTMAAAIILLLMAGVSVSTWQAVRATRAERDAKAAQLLAERERDRTLAAQQVADQRLRQAREISFNIANEIAGSLEVYNAAPRTRRKLNEIVRDGWSELSRDQPQTASDTKLAMMIYGNLFDASMALGDLPRAKREWDDYHAFAKAHATAEPKNRWSQRHFALTYDRLGNLGAAKGDFPAAEKAYLQFLELCEQAEREYKGDVHAQRDVSDALRNLAALNIQTGDHEAALPWLEKSAAILKRQQEQGLLASDSLHAKRLKWLEEKLDECRTAATKQP